MSTKTLSGQYVSTYYLNSPIRTLSITASGYLGGGLAAAGAGAYTVINDGQVRGDRVGVSFAGEGVLTNLGSIINFSTTAATAGVILDAGGILANAAGALIEGYDGADLGSSASTVTNDGQIVGSERFGLSLSAGGRVTNGGTNDTSAIISGGVALVAGLPAVVDNFGLMMGGRYLAAGGGVSFAAGGYLANGAANDLKATIVAGRFAVVVADAAGTVVNYGLLRATLSNLTLANYGVGVQLTEGGSVTNGSAADSGATIEAALPVDVAGQAGTVKNFGVIEGGDNYADAGAVYLAAGGTVVNGSTLDTSAVIGGYGGVQAPSIAATVDNFATVGGPGDEFGVNLGHGGSVTNGAAGDTSALIEGNFGVLGGVSPLTLANWGTIDADGPVNRPLATYYAVSAYGDSRVTNGGTADLSALIEGMVGVSGAATVTNFATIHGDRNGVHLVNGVLTNGAPTDLTAQIYGGTYGVLARGGTATLTNFATIQAGLGVGEGVYFNGEGEFTNGTSSDTTALVSGRDGLVLLDGKAVNWGVIAGRTDVAGQGAYVDFGGMLTNEAGARLIGNSGAGIGSMATLINLGTIQGTQGTAVQMAQPTSVLKAQAGSVFLGAVIANAGTVDAIGGVTSMKGLESGGSVIGAGTIALDGGASQFIGGVSLGVAEISVAGGSTSVDVSASLTDSRVWAQSAGTLTVDSGDKLTFTGAADSFSGTLTGAGTIAFTGGADAFSNLHLSAASMVVNGASASLSGTINLAESLAVTSTSVVVAAAGATLVGGGTLALSNKSTNLVSGATAGATLTNFDRITGAGQLGGGAMVLINKGPGVVDGNLATQLVIATGSHTVTNAGLIESTGAGGVLISSPIANTGTLMATAGTLEAAGAVSGAGAVRIAGGVADFAAAFSENVTFTGAGGVLELARSQSYTGKVTGFSKTGATAFDLLDIASATAKASYSGTSASGVLTVTDGTHTAHIALVGNYTKSTFTVSSDGHGGTIVVDPTASAPLVQAMAGFQMAPAAHLTGAQTRRPAHLASLLHAP